LRGDFAELFEGGFAIFDDLLGENIGIGEIVGFFETFVAVFEQDMSGTTIAARPFCFSRVLTC